MVSYKLCHTHHLVCNPGRIYEPKYRTKTHTELAETKHLVLPRNPSDFIQKLFKVPRVVQRVITTGNLVSEWLPNQPFHA